jgi:hypothetical protein
MEIYSPAKPLVTPSRPAQREISAAALKGIGKTRGLALSKKKAAIATSLKK